MAVQLYPCRLTHPDLEGVLEADVPASSARLAALRLRLTAVHLYHAPQLMDSTVEVDEPGPLR